MGLSFLAGTIAQGLITLGNPNYVPQPWHGTLMVIAVIAFSIIFNTSLAKKLPLVEGLILLVHVVGVFAIVIPLLVLSPRNDARTALLHFENGGNWPTMGVAFMVGLLTSLSSMLGFDCSVHMCKSRVHRVETIPILISLLQPKRSRTRRTHSQERCCGASALMWFWDTLLSLRYVSPSQILPPSSKATQDIL